MLVYQTVEGKRINMYLKKLYFCYSKIYSKLFQVVFKAYDKKNKGYIKGYELRPALSSVGYHIKTRTLNTVCHRYANRKGYIMFDDFIMCAIRLKTTIGQLKLDLQIIINMTTICVTQRTLEF